MTIPTPEQVAELFRAHRSREATDDRAIRAALFDRNRRWVAPRGYTLSDRIWRQGAWIREQVDAVLVEAIRTGEDATVTARKVEQFLDPAFAPTRTQRGRIVRGQRRGIVAEAPGRAGSGSFPARVLARTEIARAHFAGTRFAAERTPFAKGMKWNLSASHPKQDVPCDLNASRDSGLGQGIYPVRDFPSYPGHPQCICFVTIETVDDVDEVIASLRSRYGL